MKTFSRAAGALLCAVTLACPCLGQTSKIIPVTDQASFDKLGASICSAIKSDTYQYGQVKSSVLKLFLNMR